MLHPTSWKATEVSMGWCSASSPCTSAGCWSLLHVPMGIIELVPDFQVSQELAHNAVSTFSLHTYPSTHPLLPPLSLACLITRPLAFSLTHTLTHPFTWFSFISPFGYTTWSSKTFNPLTSSNFTSYDTLVLASLINIRALYWALRRQFNNQRSIRLLSLTGQKQCPFVFMVTEYLFCGDIDLNLCGRDNGKLGDNPAWVPGASGSKGQALK